MNNMYDPQTYRQPKQKEFAYHCKNCGAGRNFSEDPCVIKTISKGKQISIPMTEHQYPIVKCGTCGLNFFKHQISVVKKHYNQGKNPLGLSRENLKVLGLLEADDDIVEELIAGIKEYIADGIDIVFTSEAMDIIGNNEKLFQDLFDELGIDLICKRTDVVGGKVKYGTEIVIGANEDIVKPKVCVRSECVESLLELGELINEM